MNKALFILALANLRRWLNARVPVDSNNTLSAKDFVFLCSFMKKHNIPVIATPVVVMGKMQFHLIVQEYITITDEILEKSYILETHLSFDEIFTYAKKYGFRMITKEGKNIA
jgi:hypothetical protein